MSDAAQMASKLFKGKALQIRAVTLDQHSRNSLLATSRVGAEQTEHSLLSSLAATEGACAHGQV